MQKENSSDMRLTLYLPVVMALFCSAASAHPVSHTDAWVKVGDRVDVRLNVFLDDIVRHQIGDPEEHNLISAVDLQKAIARHGGTLLGALKIFDEFGLPLSASVTKLPRWKPTIPEINLSENTLLKLTWDLQFSFSTPEVEREIQRSNRSLCFLHSFTHPDLDAPGELRLHLQHVASGKRIDAVVAPSRPHTVVLSTETNSISESAPDTNGATSRIVVAPFEVVHEFTAPLLLLQDVWSPAKGLLEQSSSAEATSFLTTVDEVGQQQAKQQINSWMRSNTQLQIGGVDLFPLSVTVDLFAPGQTPDRADERPKSKSADLPLYGTLVGVRLRYPPVDSSNPIKLFFRAAPGDFQQLTVEVISRNGVSSEQASFGDVADESSDKDTLSFAWDANRLVQPEFPQLSEPVTVAAGTEVVAVEIRRPGIRGLLLGLTGFLFCVGAGFIKQGLSFSKARTCVLVGTTVLIGCLAIVPDSKLVVDQGSLSRLAQQVLSNVYLATMQSSETEAIDALSGVLEAELVETVYLDMSQTFSGSADEGLLIDVGNVTVKSAEMTAAAESRELVKGNFEWEVDGVIQHWGHRHSREFRLSGEITLARHDEGWKIRTISHTKVD